MIPPCRICRVPLGAAEVNAERHSPCTRSPETASGTLNAGRFALRARAAGILGRKGTRRTSRWHIHPAASRDDSARQRPGRRTSRQPHARLVWRGAHFDDLRGGGSTRRVVAARCAAEGRRGDPRPHSAIPAAAVVTSAWLQGNVAAGRGIRSLGARRAKVNEGPLPGGQHSRVRGGVKP